ncbi:uncharacterized protein BX663DRAFT_556190, partial [Cokeromyces recurvatus]|uniref:uncharacterized protein n=1 Tax=Cokeromyces recurvatus TaxID=90255 RepID=UPI00221E596D
MSNYNNVDITSILKQIASLTAKVSQQEVLWERFAALEETIAALNTKNKALEQENAALRARLAEAPARPAATPARAPAATPAVPAATPAASIEQGTEASMWSTVVARRPKATKGPAKPPAGKKVTVKRREAIVRGFNEVSGPSGYTTVYINRSRRFTKTEVRRNLRLLGAEPRRIVDVSFPARNIIGLLIHRGFEEAFEGLLAKAKIATIKDFDPLDPINVADPKYKDMDTDSRFTVALRLQNQQYIQLGWVSEEDLHSLGPRNPLASWDDVDRSSAAPASSPTDTEIDSSTPSRPSFPSTVSPSPPLLPLNIGLWNANGLQASSVDDLLRHCQISHSSSSLKPGCFLHLVYLPLGNNTTLWYSCCWQLSWVHGCVLPCLSFLSSACVPNTSAKFYALGLQLEVVSVFDSLPLSTDTIICGDLNARLGDITGDGTSNTRGNLLQQWCEEHSLSILNASLSHGVPTFLSFRHGRQVSSIVDYFLTNIPSITTSPSSSLLIRSDLSLGSDHKLMSLSFDLSVPVATPSSPPSASSSCPRRLWHLSRLAEPDVKDLYIDRFSSLSSPLSDELDSLLSSPSLSCPNIDSLNGSLNAAIYSALDSSVGTRTPRPSHWKHFWTPSLQKAADLRERCYRKWRHSSGLDKVFWWNQHIAAHAKFKQDLRTAKQLSWRAFCNALEASDMSTALKKVKQLKSRRSRSAGFVHPDGPSAGAQVMRDHLASVYSGSGLPITRPPPLPSSTSSLPFVVPEDASPSSSSLVLPSFEAVHSLLSLGLTPSLWRQAHVVPIHKKGMLPILLTSGQSPSLHHEKALRDVSLFFCCLCLSSLDVAQGGFRPNCGTLCWRLLPTFSRLSFVNLFDNVEVSVLLSNNVSLPFSPCTGVLQGSVLSPHLYSVYINSLAPLLRSAASPRTASVLSSSPSDPIVPPWYPVTMPAVPSPTPVNCLLYADDVALIGSAREVQTMLQLSESHSASLGYRWSPPKCAVLNPPSATSSTSVTLSLYSVPLPVVEEFIYLGVPFRRAGISSPTIVTKRKPGTMLQMSQLNALGANRSGFSLLFSSRLYASSVRPKLEYGLAISQLRGVDYTALEKVQNRCLRMIFGGHGTSSTTVFCHLTNLPSMRFRADTLVAKFCLRARGLPPDCLLSLLSSSLSSPTLSSLCGRPLARDMPDSLGSRGHPVSFWLRRYRQ